jgi:hypothetical protein
MARTRIAAAVLLALAALAGGAWLAGSGAGDLDVAAAASGATQPGATASAGSTPATPSLLPAASIAPAPAGAEPPEAVLHRAGFSAEWLAAHGFATAEARHRLQALLDAGRELPGAARQRLAIRPSGASAAEARDTVRLAPEEGYVVAGLTAPLVVQEDAVLVRWRRQGDEQVMQLAPQAAPRGPGEPLQLWSYRPHGWEPGSYRLEVISANPGLEVLAAASFEIVAPGGKVDPFAYTAQVSTGR